jgi:PAS domain S-box-containing protein
MGFKLIHSYFPFPRLFKLLVFLSVSMQFIVITQMIVAGNNFINDAPTMLFRVFRGTLMTFISGSILAYPALVVIRLLNQRLPWKGNGIKRFLLQFSAALFSGILVTPVILILARFIFALKYDSRVFLDNVYYMIVLSLFLIIILEAWIYLEESIKEKIKAEKLEKDLIEEAAKKEIFEAKAQVEEIKANTAHQLIEQEKRLNQELQSEMNKSEQLALKLKESRGQLQSLLSNLIGAAYRCYFDESYSMQYISEQICDISGYPSTDFVNNQVRSYASIIHPDDKETCAGVIGVSAKNRVPFEMEYRIIHANGNVAWVKENGKPIYDEDGNVAFLDGIIIDISRRKEAELTAKESDRKYKELMDFLPQPIFELDLHGNLVYGNKAGYDFFGLRPSEGDPGTSVLDCFVKEDLPRIVENIKKSVEGIVTEPAEYTAIKGDGTLCPVMVFGSPIVRDGMMTGRRGIIIDISERKRYEMKLVRAKEELEMINASLEQMVQSRTRELTETSTKLLKVQKENLQSQFEVLKSQINPHFMFNSLNVLSGLINKDIFKAQQFIDEFSHIYRYVLETLEQQVVTLGKELDFTRSYLFLQQIRHGNDLSYSINLPSSLLNRVLPPLSLQVVLENAIKHNIVNESKPLRIEVFSEDCTLIVRNNIQPKISAVASTGLGLKNLVKRYGLISEFTPTFQLNTEYYVARLPLIETE